MISIERGIREVKVREGKVIERRIEGDR